MKYLKIFSVLIFFFYFSCDYIEQPSGSYYFAKDTVSKANDTIDTLTVQKKVILIEFTGIRCVNCPDAHEIIHQIENSHPNNFIAVSIHGTSLARPIGEFSGQPDLRTEEGNTLIQDFGISSIPIGMVDFFDKNYLSEQPAVKINLNTCYCNQKAKISVEVQTLQEFNKNLKLCVYLLEDSIITKQASTEGTIDNYVQMNVFRKSLTNIYGNTIFSGETAAYSTYNQSFNVDLPSDWQGPHCKAVALVYEDDTKKILNAEISKFSQ